jgi:hypothetical protein
LAAHFLLRFIRDSGRLGGGLTGLMAKNSDHLAGRFEAENTGGVLSGLLAEEDELDRGALWRIGSWGAAAVTAVVVAVLANQTSLGWRRDQFAAADLMRQAQQLQALTKDSQNETRRLASAIDTLDSDRDRLYSRVTILEQGLESVTGTIARQNSTPIPAASRPAATSEPQPSPPGQNQAAAPAVAPVTTAAPATTTVLAKTDPAPKMDRPRTDAKTSEAKTSEAKTSDAKAMEPNPVPAPSAAQAAASPAAPVPSSAPAATQPAPATPLIAAKSMLAPPDPGAPKLIEAEKPAAAKADELPAAKQTAFPASKEPDTSDAASSDIAVQRTEFAVDVGSANSIGGLRALWRGLTKSNSELAALHPIIMVKESATGLGMQLHLAAGPLNDAAAAAKICAALVESQRSCETTLFDGQRLAISGDDQQPLAPKPALPQQHRRGYNYPKRTTNEVPPPKPPSSTLSRWFAHDTPKP